MTCTFCNDRKLINCLKTNQISDNEATAGLTEQQIKALGLMPKEYKGE